MRARAVDPRARQSPRRLPVIHLHIAVAGLREKEHVTLQRPTLHPDKASRTRRNAPNGSVTVARSKSFVRRTWPCAASAMALITATFAPSALRAAATSSATSTVRRAALMVEHAPAGRGSLPFPLRERARGSFAPVPSWRAFAPGFAPALRPRSCSSARALETEEVPARNLPGGLRRRWFPCT